MFICTLARHHSVTGFYCKLSLKLLDTIPEFGLAQTFKSASEEQPTRAQAVRPLLDEAPAEQSRSEFLLRTADILSAVLGVTLFDELLKDSAIQAAFKPRPLRTTSYSSGERGVIL